MTESHFTVSEVAKRAHVSVRALHHYDEIGLLTPARRSAAGYRLYSDADLSRLHEILLFRELGMPLDEIRSVIDAPAPVRADALRKHREGLDERLRRTQAVIRAVDATLASMERGKTMGHEVFDGFEQFDHAKYAEEAEERWGDTDAYRESQKRTKQYTKEDWSRIREESESIMDTLARLSAEGRTPQDEAVLAAAEQHRQHIGRWFYPCSPAMHAGLADMYVADPRFGEHFEKRAAGLTEFVAAAFRENANRRT